MSETIIKQNDFVTCSIDVNRGYIIRLRAYQGATFTVKMDLSIEIGQSSRMSYDKDIWNLLLQELEVGKKYMIKVNLAGGFPKDFTSKKNCSTIKPSQYIDNSLYVDSKGRTIFYIGKAEILDRFGNREGCTYLYAVINNLHDIKVMNGKIHIYVENVLNIDSYVGKPSKLTKLLQSFPRDIAEIVGHTKSGYEYYYKFRRL